MDDYKDIKEILKPCRDIKASESFRSRIDESIKKHDHTSLAKRWFIGGISLSTAVAIMILSLIPTGMSAKEILTRAITAMRNSMNIEMTVEIRTLSRDNFSFIDPDLGFITHDIKIMHSDSLSYWSINKGGRAAEKKSDGVYMWIEQFNIGWKSKNPNWDVLGYLSVIMNPEKILVSELQLALTESGTDYNMRKENGNIYLTVSSRAEGDFVNPYMLNKSISESNNIRRYVIDAENYRLKSASLSMIHDNKEIEVLKIIDIKYNPSNFQLLTIPSDIRFIDTGDDSILMGLQGLDEKETASALFNALRVWNTDILDKILNPVVSEGMYRQYYEGTKLLNLGNPFKSGNHEEITFIPYTVRLKDGSIKSMNLALVKSSQGGWVVSGGL